MLLGCLGCDASYSYRPEGWVPQRGGFTWVKNVGRVKLLTWGIGELMGSESITPEFEVTNQSSVPFVVESADLFVGSQAYSAQLPGHGELQWRTVLPGTVRRVALQWSFKESAWKVLGKRAKMILRIRQGVSPLTLEIDYTRIE
jgi:hypothetical protein